MDVDNRTYAIWHFELYPDLKHAKAQDDKDLSTMRPGLTNRTEVRGYLSKNHGGLIVNPEEDPVAGYYVTVAANLVGLRDLTDEETDEVYEKYGDYMALLYISSESSAPDLVGVFQPLSWKEEYPRTSTTPVSFRIPTPLLEDFKAACSSYNISQAAVVTNAMWDHAIGWRIESITISPNILLGNGEEWKPDYSIPYVRIDAGDGC